MKQPNADDIKAIKMVRFILIAILILMFLISIKVHNENSVSSQSSSWIYNPVADNLSFKKQ